MKKQIVTFIYFALFSLQVLTQSLGLENRDDSARMALANLQQRWAIANYALEGKAQMRAFEQLITDVESATTAQADNVEFLVWSGIIKSTFAGINGGLRALKSAKSAKEDLDRAITIDGSALEGAAYTSLGTLYYQVPGNPLGFGDSDKAEELLEKAVAINPTGIDSNYFYAQYLLAEKRYDKAIQHLLKAQKATPRPQRPLADKGRQTEITLLLKAAHEKQAL